MQFVVAGAVLGFVLLQTGWLSPDGSARRAEVRHGRATWMFAWTAALAVMTLVSGMLGLVQDPAWTEVLLALRFVALGASVFIGLPAIQAYAGGPSVRFLALATAAWYGVATGLWLTTDLVHRPGLPGGLPAYGPLAAAVDLVPVLAIAIYVGLVLRRTRMTPVGGLVAVTGTVSAALLVASSFPPPTVLTELLKGVWALPLVLGLQVMATRRVAWVRRVAARRTRLRGALAAVSHAAWETPDPVVLLDRTREEAREVLDDVTVHARLRVLGPDRAVAELWSERDLDQDALDFLDDLGRVVSTAAERHALTARLRRAAFVDVLTGLPSRTALDEHLADLLDSGARVALMVIDVEGLKHTNERLGHRAGDELLVRTADHLTGTLARLEGEDVYVARVGGDEFAAVLVGGHSTDRLRSLAREIRDGFADAGCGRSRLTVGIAHATTRSPVALQRHADRAMSEARRTHAGIAYFDDRLREREAQRAAVSDELETAVAEGRIVAHFQPVADPVSLEVVGYEVLARWQDGDVLRAPGSWLPLAEETGLIVEVGKQMFAQARAGMERFGLPVAVNVAARQLDEPDVLRHIEESWGSDAWDRLTIEVTESAIVHDLQHVRAALTELAARGARISLDDFGTGYNSLARLGSLPLHVLKIDKSLIDDATSPQGSAVLRAVVALAEAHGLEVVAEGVEHREQLTALIDLGVDLVQGNLLGRPQADPSARPANAPTQRRARARRAAIA